MVGVEAAAGRHAVVEAGPGPGPLLWHTNHGRYVPGAEPEARGTSAARGETLHAVAIPLADLAEGNPRAQCPLLPTSPSPDVPRDGEIDSPLAG